MDGGEEEEGEHNNLRVGRDHSQSGYHCPGRLQMTINIKMIYQPENPLSRLYKVDNFPARITIDRYNQLQLL